MIYAVTVTMDVQTIDPSLPARLIGRAVYGVGMTRRIPGGMLAFQAAYLNTEPGEPSLYRFALQFGSVRDAAAAGNWLFAQLHSNPAALSLAGNPIPIDHHTIIKTLQQVA